MMPALLLCTICDVSVEIILAVSYSIVSMSEVNRRGRLVAESVQRTVALPRE